MLRREVGNLRVGVEAEKHKKKLEMYYYSNVSDYHLYLDINNQLAIL